MVSQQLNLIPPAFLVRRQARRRLARWTRVAIIVVALVGASRLGLANALERERARLRVMTAAAEARRQAEIEVELLRAERDRLAGVLVERTAVMPAASLLDLFRALETSMPAELYLRGLAAEQAADANSPEVFDIHLQGVAPATDSVAVFLFRLAGRPDMSATDLEFSQRNDEGVGGGVSFAVKTRFHPAAAVR